jgi:hypothetical protein
MQRVILRARRAGLGRQPLTANSNVAGQSKLRPGRAGARTGAGERREIFIDRLDDPDFDIGRSGSRCAVGDGSGSGTDPGEKAAGRAVVSRDPPSCSRREARIVDCGYVRHHVGRGVAGARELAGLHRADRFWPGNSQPCGWAALYQARNSASRCVATAP